MKLQVAGHHAFILLACCLVSGVIGQACNSTTCQLPGCSCPRFSSPMSLADTPQIVYFGFDDAVTNIAAAFFDQLFAENRTNPNGCRMKMSLFVSHAYTNYTEVKKFYDLGHEIGVHSVTHINIDNDTILLDEARDQKANLVNAGISEDDILGWRSPNLKTAGENQPSILKGLNYTYDISLTYTLTDRLASKPWPFTMIEGWPYNCQIEACPVNLAIENFWTVPVVSLRDKDNTYPCVYVDGCSFPANNENDAYHYLLHNFLSNYNATNSAKTPFGFNMHAAWFVGRPYNLNAMARFLDTLMDLPDVYVVTVKQMLDWMQNPTAIGNLDTLSSWQCEGTHTTQSTTAPTTSTTASTSQTGTSTASTTTGSTSASTTPSTSQSTTASTTPTTTTESTTTSTTPPTTASTTSSGGSCRGAGAYENYPGMDEWCNNNCPTYCPASHCLCDK